MSTGSQISGTVTASVYVGTSPNYYSSPLTITSTGEVAPISGFGNFAVYLERFTHSTVVNAGTVLGAAGKSNVSYPAPGQVGVFNYGGFLDTTGIILGGAGGNETAYGAGGGAGGVGVYLYGGTLIASGSIAGGHGGYGNDVGGPGGIGIKLNRTGGTVTVSGTVTGGAGGNGGTFGNVGGAGIFIEKGTVTDSGTVTGGATGTGPGGSATMGDAVQFGSLAATLIVDPGAVFNGDVVASAGVADLLEFSGTSKVALTGIGTQFTNFHDLSFASGAAWTIEGDTAGLAATGETINGFTSTDQIVLDGFDANLTDTTYVSGTGLELTDKSGNHATLDITGPYATSSFIETVFGGNTTIAVHCYASGTRIETPQGDIAIEDLRIGDPVTTASGAPRPIRWIGQRRFDPRFVGRNPNILPIRICRDALADGIPRRDLLVSPEHAMLIDGVLVAAKHLINGVSIRQEDPGSIIEYVHLELATHDAILAEGAASETYVEDGDRGMFHNAPAFRSHDPAPPRYCAERIEPGPRLEAIRAELDARAGVHAMITEEPDIHLLADGAIIRPRACADRELGFDLPRAARDLVLVSRRTTGAGADCRGLGVAVAGIVIGGEPIDLGTLPDRGWHHLEREGARSWRWTDGAAQLPPTAQACRITLAVVGTLYYRQFALAA